MTLLELLLAELDKKREEIFEEYSYSSEYAEGYRDALDFVMESLEGYL